MNTDDSTRSLTSALPTRHVQEALARLSENPMVQQAIEVEGLRIGRSMQAGDGDDYMPALDNDSMSQIAAFSPAQEGQFRLDDGMSSPF